MESSTIQKNAGAGLMLGSGNRVIGSCLRDNGQYGFNAYAESGVKNVVLRTTRSQATTLMIGRSGGKGAAAPAAASSGTRTAPK